MKKYEIIENGLTYIIHEKNGKIVAKYLKSTPTTEPEPIEEPTQLDIIQANTDYIVMMME